MLLSFCWAWDGLTLDNKAWPASAMTATDANKSVRTITFLQLVGQFTQSLRAMSPQAYRRRQRVSSISLPQTQCKRLHLTKTTPARIVGAPNCSQGCFVYRIFAVGPNVLLGGRAGADDRELDPVRLL